MYHQVLVVVCKVLTWVLRRTGRAGSSLPGLVMERLAPGFLAEQVEGIRDRTVVVAGTNGKTTTTGMVVAMLDASGEQVLTNKTGSNLTRGIVSSIVNHMTWSGGLHATAAVFEIDEAYAPALCHTIRPRAFLGLNVLRDQMDRYGELDRAAALLKEAADHAGSVVLNHEDPRLRDVAGRLRPDTPLAFFGVSDELRQRLANEENLHGGPLAEPSPAGRLAVCLSGISADLDGGSQTVDLIVDDEGVPREVELRLGLVGLHNALNLSAALAVVRAFRPGIGFDQVQAGLDGLGPAFGRGETLDVHGVRVVVGLVKNPSGFASNLEAFVKLHPTEVVIAINDDYADGRDVSWLWDVPLAEHLPTETPCRCTGRRAYDMALRLQYEGYTDVVAEPSVGRALDATLAGPTAGDVVLVLPTYTALFEVRREMERFTEVGRIW